MRHGERPGSIGDRERGAGAPNAVAGKGTVTGAMRARTGGRNAIQTSVACARNTYERALIDLPAAEAAIDPEGARDLTAARLATGGLSSRLEMARTRIAQARAQAEAAAPDLLPEIDALAGAIAATCERAQPILALTPPTYTTAADRDAVAFSPDPDAAARVEEAEARESTDWNAALDDAAVQRKQSAASALTSDDVRHTAADGVHGATAPLPHLDRIQAAFGHHDIGHVRAQVGGDGAAAAGAIGAEAYAIGDRVAFAAAPDLHTAAHEAAHTVQQGAGVSLLGGVGVAGDAYEVQADAVADAVVAGQSAEAILDAGTAGGSHAGTSAVQRKPRLEHGNAARYLDLWADEILTEIDVHLSAVDWPQPDPRLPWLRPSLFKAELWQRLRSAIATPSKLRRLCYPQNPMRAVDERRPMYPAPEGTPETPSESNPFVGGPVGDAEWRSSIGRAIALQLHEAIQLSLRRLAPRWVASADRDDRTTVAFEQLVTSHPMDVVVGHAMTPEAECVFGFEKDPDRTGMPPPPGVTIDVREVSCEWQGGIDNKLWNWVKATPANATAEEVAAHLFHGKTHEAYLITAAPPLFGIEPKRAMKFTEASAHAPSDALDAGPTDRVLAVAAGSASAEIALHQGADEKLPPVEGRDPRAKLFEILQTNFIQLANLREALVPWGQAGLIDLALGFLLAQQSTFIAPNPDEDLAAWGRVLMAQQGNLYRVSKGIEAVTDAARDMGVTDPSAPDARALRDVVAAYARAAGTAHLADTSRELLSQAAAKQARLTILAAQGSARGLDLALEQLDAMGPDAQNSHYGGGVDESGTGSFDLSHRGIELRAESMELQSKLIAGETVDAEELDRLTLESDRLALRARARVVILQLRSLRDAAEQASQGMAAEIASWFSDEFDGLESMCDRMWHRIDDAVVQMDAQPFLKRQNDYCGKDYNVLEPRAALRRAEQEIAAVAGDAGFAKFLRNGAQVVQNQQFRTACVQVAAMIGISIGAGVAGAWVGDALGGAMASRAGVAAVSDLSLGARAVGFGAQILTDAAINTAGQGAMQGTGFDGSLLLENMVFSVGATAILRGFELGAQTMTQAERATATIWRRVGSNVVLYETAAISFHTIMGAALGYVSHLVVAQKSQPPPATMEEWFLQGASMAVGRHVGHAITTKLASYQQLSRANARGVALHESAKTLVKLSSKVQEHPEANDALDVIRLQRELIAEEISVLEGIADDPDALARAELTAAKIHNLELPRLQAQLAEVHGSAATEIDLHLSGLEEVLAGAWRGTREQIERARKASMGGEVRWTEGNLDTPWTVTVDGRTYKIYERGEGVPPSFNLKNPGSRTVLAGTDAPMAASAEWIQPIAGTLDLIIHSDGKDFYVRQPDGQYAPHDHRWLAKQVHKDGTFDQIRLVACKSGENVEGLAQQLADELQITVWAPTDIVHAREDGALIIAEEPKQSTGRWVQFKAGKPGRKRGTRHAADAHNPVDSGGDTMSLGRGAARFPREELTGLPPGYEDLAELDGYHIVSGRDPGRPTWQESEQRVSDDLNWADFDDQRSFQDGKEVKRGTPRSTRPDNYSDSLSLSIDVKNYDVSKRSGRRRLVSKVVEQLRDRALHLPAGSRQGVVVDVRGQAVDEAVTNEIRTQIVEKAGGLIDASNIEFITE